VDSLKRPDCNREEEQWKGETTEGKEGPSRKGRGIAPLLKS